VTSDRFFQLLPDVIKAPAGELNTALRDLLRVLGTEADLLEEDIRQMYADLFIETCDSWVIPYIGDLVGFTWLPVPEGRPECRRELPAGLVPRQAVADAIRLRARKGTRSALEDLVSAVGGWPAVVCDGEPAHNGAAPNGNHDVDCAGAPPNTVTVRLWRLPAWPLTYVQPYTERLRVNSFHLSVLGNRAPLYTSARPAAVGERLEGLPIPRPLTVEMLEGDLASHYGQGKSLLLYEDGAPIAAERIKVYSLEDWAPEVFGNEVAVDPERGRVMFRERYDLGELTASYWYGFPTAAGGGEYRRPQQRIPVESSFFRPEHLDPGLPTRLLGDEAPFSRYLRGLMDPAVVASLSGEESAARVRLSAELNRIIQAYDLADGLQDEPLDDEATELLNSGPGGPGRIRLNRLIIEAQYQTDIRRSYAVTRVSSRRGPSIAKAVRALQESQPPPAHLVVELSDSGLYVQSVQLEVGAFETLEIRAAEGCRPTIILPERKEHVDDMTVTCQKGSRVIMDGLMVAAHPVRVAGDPAEVIIRDCTFVPGWDLDVHSQPHRGAEPSLVLTDLKRRRGPRGPVEVGEGSNLNVTCVEIEKSIIGTVLVQRDEVRAEPMRLNIRASVVDSTTSGGDAIAAPNKRPAHVVATVIDSTVIGRTRVHAIELGENSIFTSTVNVARMQVGCLRYCYVPAGSTTPRRHECQPDLVMRAAGVTTPGTEAAAVEPKFVTLRYGLPDYCRLAPDCPVEIQTGADDDEQMGVYHDLFESRREANLRAAVGEQLPLGWGFIVTAVT
jgi:hypothetical protein